MAPLVLRGRGNFVSRPPSHTKTNPCEVPGMRVLSSFSHTAVQRGGWEFLPYWGFLLDPTPNNPSHGTWGPDWPGGPGASTPGPQGLGGGTASALVPPGWQQSADPGAGGGPPRDSGHGWPRGRCPDRETPSRFMNRFGVPGTKKGGSPRNRGSTGDPGAVAACWCRPVVRQWSTARGGATGGESSCC